MAYMKNRKDRPLKRMTAPALLTDTQIQQEAKISIECLSYWHSVLNTWPPRPSRGFHTPLETLREKFLDLWDSTGWSSVCLCAKQRGQMPKLREWEGEARRGKWLGENAFSVPKLHRWPLFLPKGIVFLTWQMLNWIQFCLFKWHIRDCYFYFWWGSIETKWTYISWRRGHQWNTHPGPPLYPEQQQPSGGFASSLGHPQELL